MATSRDAPTTTDARQADAPYNPRADPTSSGQRGLTAHSLVPRPALLAKLERGDAGRVMIVAASAGSGKTLLVRAWLESRRPKQRQAWVSVERGERDGQRFWSMIVSALRAAAPSGVMIEALSPTPQFEGQSVVERLISELAALDQRLVLVIDDLHELAAHGALEQLTFLLDHLPDALEVVLLTRRDLPLGLHRRRLAGELIEIRNTDLRFALEESESLLAASGIVLSDDGLRLLHERTEGWVAGLRMAAISLASHADPERFVREFSGSERTVSEYLLAEVLDSQPAHVRRLLVRASLLERVNGALGDLLTGGSGAEHDLQSLADAGVFVVALDSARTWFRFHHLFADLLAVELRHTEPDIIPALHLVAATWHSEHGNAVEAIAHAQAGGDRELAAGLLIEHYFSLALDGLQATAHALLEAFAPNPDVSPEIAAVVAIDELAQGSLDQAAAYLALAARHADAVPEDRRHRFDRALLVTRLTLARRLGDFRSVLEEIQQDAYVEDVRTGRDISMHNDVRALRLMNLGIVEVWSGRTAEGAQHLEEAGELARRIGRPFLQVGCHAHWAQAISGTSFTRARATAQEAVALAESHGWGGDPVIGPALVTLGVALLQAGRLDEAEHWLARADRTLRPDLEPAVGFVLHMARGALHLARDRNADALASFDDAGQLQLLLITGSPLAVQRSSATLQAMLRLGQAAAVRDALANMSESERDTGELREVLAALALAEDDPHAALAALAPTLSGTAPVHHAVVLVRSSILEAIALDALGQSAAAEDAIERALDIAQADALLLPFLHVPSRELLERHPRYRTAHGAFIAELLDALSGRPLSAQGSPPPPLREALSDAELRVLRYLPSNLPAAGIAGEISISVNTVKTHMRHIYAKLGAHNRVEAVKRARELGLVGRSGRHD